MNTNGCVVLCCALSPLSSELIVKNMPEQSLHVWTCTGTVSKKKVKSEELNVFVLSLLW